MKDGEMNRKTVARQINEELLQFLDASPNAFFAVRNMKDMLLEEGYTELREGDRLEIRPGSRCFVTRNNSALIAFRMPHREGFSGFQIMASHCDSPVFKIKTNAEITVDDRYVKLNVEKYGGMLCAPWLDRPLSVAGRIMVRTAEGIETRLVNVDRSLLIIRVGGGRGRGGYSGYRSLPVQSYARRKPGPAG